MIRFFSFLFFSFLLSFPVFVSASPSPDNLPPFSPEEVGSGYTDVLSFSSSTRSYCRSVAQPSWFHIYYDSADYTFLSWVDSAGRIQIIPPPAMVQSLDYHVFTQNRDGLCDNSYTDHGGVNYLGTSPISMISYPTFYVDYTTLYWSSVDIGLDTSQPFFNPSSGYLHPLTSPFLPANFGLPEQNQPTNVGISFPYPQSSYPIYTLAPQTVNFELFIQPTDSDYSIDVTEFSSASDRQNNINGTSIFGISLVGDPTKSRLTTVFPVTVVSQQNRYYRVFVSGNDQSTEFFFSILPDDNLDPITGDPSDGGWGGFLEPTINAYSSKFPFSLFGLVTQFFSDINPESQGSISPISWSYNGQQIMTIDVSSGLNQAVLNNPLPFSPNAIFAFIWYTGTIFAIVRSLTANGT